MINKKGFTLAELLIVIVILGIMGAIALPRFYPQKEKAQIAEAVATLSAIRQGEAAYHLETSTYYDPLTGASGWGGLGIDAPDMTNWTYTADDTTGTGTATRDAGADANYASKTVTLAIDGTWGGDHPFKPSN